MITNLPRLGKNVRQRPKQNPTLDVSDDRRSQDNRQVIIVPARHLFYGNEGGIFRHQAGFNLWIRQGGVGNIVGVVVSIPGALICPRLAYNVAHEECGLTNALPRKCHHGGDGAAIFHRGTFQMIRRDWRIGDAPRQFSVQNRGEVSL